MIRAIRSWRRDGLLMIAAVVTIAVGIAASVATFAVIDAVLVRKLPVRDQNTIVVMGAANRAHPEHPIGVPNGLLWALAANTRMLSGVAGIPSSIASTPFAGRDGTRTIHLAVSPVTSNLFQVLGVAPSAGRLLDTLDDANGAAVSAVLSYTAYRRVFSGDGHVVGRIVQLLGTSVRIVGVAPAGFDYPHATDAWVSEAQLARQGGTPDPSDGEWTIVARLRPGAAIGAARAEFASVLRSYQDPRLGDAPARFVVAQPLRDVVLGDQRRDLLVLAAGVGLVLLVACTNVAGLLFARGLARAAEMRIRAALGATPATLTRQLLMENALIVVSAAVLGTVLAEIALRLTLALAPPGVVRLDEARIDPSTLLFTVGLTAAVVLLAAPRRRGRARGRRTCARPDAQPDSDGSSSPRKWRSRSCYRPPRRSSAKVSTDWSISTRALISSTCCSS